MSASPKPPNPRLALWFLAAIMVVQGFYAAVEIFRDEMDTTQPIRLLVGALWFVYAALIGAFAVGVWKHTRWAWVAGIVAAGSGLVLTGLRIVAGDTFSQHVLSILIDGALLFYLFRPSIRALFEPEAGLDG